MTGAKGGKTLTHRAIVLAVKGKDPRWSAERSAASRRSCSQSVNAARRSASAPSPCR
jgi:hypothetical protein